MKRYSLLICLLLNACVNLPSAIKDAPDFDVTYSQVNQNIANYKTANIRWGGVIIDVENEQTYTLLQVLYYPLNYYGRPQLNEPNHGRFIIKSTDFLDPAVYAKNKEITVAGTIIGDVERFIGNKSLRLPMVSASLIYLWPDYERNYYGGFGAGYPYGYYGYPFYWGGYYRPYRW